MLTITTNNHWRPVLDWFELTDSERAQFDYLTNPTDYVTFIRYRGEVYSLDDFMAASTLLPWNELRTWDGYFSDSFFSGVVVRYSLDCEYVKLGSYYVS